LPNEGAAVAWISSQLDRRLDRIKDGTKTDAKPHLRRSESSWIVRLFGQRSFAWAFPAAVVAALAIAGAFLLRPEKAPQLQAGLETQRPVYRSQELQVVSPVGEVQQVPAELAWQAVEGSVTYHVVIMEVDRSELWAGETRDKSIEIPNAVRVKFLPGKPLLWQVTAQSERGQTLSASQVQRFVLAAASTRKPTN
jgi:hypothetical protein